MAEDEKDVIDILTADHREVEAMFTELETLLETRRGSDDELRADLDQVSAEDAQRAKVEHAEAEQTLKRLEGIDPNDPAFERELRELLREIREHLEEEEGEMFPRMRDILTQDELVELGTRVEAIKTMAPTRPHPSVPHDPAADPRGHSRSPQQVTWGTATRAMWEH
jgi:hemerythrin superfamily protein